MTFLTLILTNLRRHRIRTLIGIAGIAFGVAAMLSVITILHGAIRMFERILSDDSEAVVFERNVSDLFFSSVPLEQIERIRRWEMVAHANPVLFGIVSGSNNPVVTCFGVEADDARLRSANWIAGQTAGFAKEEGVVLGQRAAEFLKARVGDLVPIGKETFRVAGIIKSANGFEDGGVFMPLNVAQRFFHKEAAASIATVKLVNKTETDAFKNRVTTEFPGLIALENKEFSRSYSQFRILKTTAWAVGGCAFLLGGLSVANTMIMSVFTRIREIAVLRVCGFSRAQVAILILGESGLVSLAGVILGMAISQTGLLTLKSLPLLQGYIDPHIEPFILLQVALVACVTGHAGAIYPASFGARIEAAEALRYE
jgi:putative ABC transport system permease protein